MIYLNPQHGLAVKGLLLPFLSPPIRPHVGRIGTMQAGRYRFWLNCFFFIAPTSLDGDPSPPEQIGRATPGLRNAVIENQRRGASEEKFQLLLSTIRYICAFEYDGSPSCCTPTLTQISLLLLLLAAGIVVLGPVHGSVRLYCT